MKAVELLSKLLVSGLRCHRRCVCWTWRT